MLMRLLQRNLQRRNVSYGTDGLRAGNLNVRLGGSALLTQFEIDG
ncbi:MAG: hypothetical protein ACXQTM_03685 [Methanosarcinales archaeon]